MVHNRLLVIWLSRELLCPITALPHLCCEGGHNRAHGSKQRFEDGACPWFCAERVKSVSWHGQVETWMPHPYPLEKPFLKAQWAWGAMWVCDRSGGI